MISLSPVTWEDIQTYFVDFQKKSKVFELPPEEDQAYFIGIYNDSQFIGYYIMVPHNDAEIEIRQGYLTRNNRHLDLPKQCMAELERLCKLAGYKTIALSAGSRFKAYLKFAKSLGYKPVALEFTKEL